MFSIFFLLSHSLFCSFDFIFFFFKYFCGKWKKILGNEVGGHSFRMQFFISLHLRIDLKLEECALCGLCGFQTVNFQEYTIKVHLVEMVEGISREQWCYLC